MHSTLQEQNTTRTSSAVCAHGNMCYLLCLRTASRQEWGQLEPVFPLPLSRARSRSAHT